MAIAKALPLLGVVLFMGCGGVIGVDEESSDSAELSVPKKVKVNGVIVDVESNYLPRVVQCENPGAPMEALKAQAVAARTYLTYRSDGKATPTIQDGESDQVYTCASNNNGRFVSADALQAVKETAGEVVLFNGRITAGFFVAGASRSSASCKRLSDPTNTERFVTFNFGLLDPQQHESSIGYRHDVYNRGALGQRLANCLANLEQYDYQSLLRYFYGSDSQIGLLGSVPPTQAEMTQQAINDLPLAACYSNTLGRPVGVGSCVQSASDRYFYQCKVDGQFEPAPVDGAGQPIGPNGPCTVELWL